MESPSSDAGNKSFEVCIGRFCENKQKAAKALIILRFSHLIPCFCLRLRQSAIMAMNSEFVGLPFIFDTV